MSRPWHGAFLKPRGARSVCRRVDFNERTWHARCRLRPWLLNGDGNVGDFLDEDEAARDATEAEALVETGDVFV